jgi:predicted HAD superfamily phosphohydrolase
MLTKSEGENAVKTFIEALNEAKAKLLLSNTKTEDDLKREKEESIKKFDEFYSKLNEIEKQTIVDYVKSIEFTVSTEGDTRYATSLISSKTVKCPKCKFEFKP